MNFIYAIIKVTTDYAKGHGTMKKFFLKHETLCAILLIILYVVINSFCLNSFGLTDYRTALVNTAFSALLIALTVALGRVRYYGLTMPRDAKNYLWFLPLLLIISVNLWGGINTSHTTNEILFHTISMINVGFIEEIIFRGFLFKMMAQNGIKSAVIVSALTFGVGHIVNLFNGADVIPTLLQICYAAAIGFLFVIIFLKSGSLIPCIITHCAVNSLSIFSVENETLSYITAAFLTVVPIAYAIYIIKRTEKQH